MDYGFIFGGNYFLRRRAKKASKGRKIRKYILQQNLIFITENWFYSISMPKTKQQQNTKKVSYILLNFFIVIGDRLTILM